MKDAPEVIDICSEVAREMRLPSISQVRLVHRSEATLGFTQHEPKTAVFEVGLIDDDRFPEFERRMDAALREAGIRYTMHWSKNSGIDPQKLDYMYGAAKIASWKAARRAVFGNDATLMKMFETDAMVRAGLAWRHDRAALSRRRSGGRAATMRSGAKRVDSRMKPRSPRDHPRPVARPLDAAPGGEPVRRPAHPHQRLARLLHVQQQLVRAELLEHDPRVRLRDHDRRRQQHLVHAPVVRLPAQPQVRQPLLDQRPLARTSSCRAWRSATPRSAPRSPPASSRT